MNKTLESDTQVLEPALTPDEQQRLHALEQVVKEGEMQFIAMGRALLEIRESRLYRAEFPNFEAYCSARWHRSRVRMGQYIHAFVLNETLETTGFQIENEREARAVREALGTGEKALTPDDQRLVVQFVQSMTETTTPTPQEIGAVAATVRALHNHGVVEHPETGEVVPWADVPPEHRMAVISAAVTSETVQRIRQDKAEINDKTDPEKLKWMDFPRGHLKGLPEGQEVVIRVYRNGTGEVVHRARVEVVRDWGELLAEGEETMYLKHAILSLLDEVKHG